MVSIPDKMKAVVITGPNEYGIQEVRTPEPGPQEVLCRIRAVAICGSDPKIFDGSSLGMWPPAFPFIAGHEWAGEIVKVGPGVSDFVVGDRVAGEAHKGCGMCRACKRGEYNLCENYARNERGHRHYGFTAQGAYAEYNVYSTKSIARIPASLSFVEGSLVDTAGIALHGVELAGITPGGTAVVFGPGPVGLLVAGLTKALGAGRTAVVGRGPRLKMAREFGADELIDIESSDPVAAVKGMTGGRGADEVFECSGAHVAARQAVEVVRKGGKIVLLGLPSPPEVSLPLKSVILNQISILGSRGNPNVSEKVIALIAGGKLNVGKLVTHRFPLAEIRKAVETFVKRLDGALKVVVEP